MQKSNLEKNKKLKQEDFSSQQDFKEDSYLVALFEEKFKNIEERLNQYKQPESIFAIIMAHPIFYVATIFLGSLLTLYFSRDEKADMIRYINTRCDNVDESCKLRFHTIEETINSQK